MEYCNDSSAVETLFQYTQHLLGRYVQFLDQSRGESMPLHLFKSDVYTCIYFCAETDVFILIYIRTKCYNAGLHIMELIT